MLFLLFYLLHRSSCGKGSSRASHFERLPLSEAGQQRAAALAQRLKEANITQIFSTNTIRTTGTAAPLGKANGVSVQLYNAGDTTFILTLKAMEGKNVLVVGHSNTVDDLVNGLTGKVLLQDLPDTQYGDVFIIKKRGKRHLYSVSRFGN
ncbi:MAG: phosphoglycerate mutase family protein [Segetibacter sp.]